MQRHWPVVEAYFRRGAVCWLGTRAIVTCVLFFGALPVRLTAFAAFEMVLLSIGISVLETFRQRETVLLGDLSIHPLELGSIFAAPAVLGELVLWLAGSAVA